jgi:flavin-dependent dehydrogenase
MAKNKTIVIGGAGIAGLTAAINLALRGFDVVVHEKRANVGLKHRGDFQGLENWTSPKDMLEFLDEINIEHRFEYEPFRECLYFDRKLQKYHIRSNRVGFYLVKRGPTPGTLDYHLLEQARRVGVEVKFASTIELSQADVVATGSPSHFLLARGINFETNLGKVAYGLFDDSVAPAGYAYLVGFGGYATIAVVTVAGVKDLLSYLESAIAKFHQLAEFDIKNPVGFGGVGTRFERLGSGIPRVGEAAGFQDALWGFGMRLAFESGYLTAKAISEGLDYWELARRSLVPLCRSSNLNRLLYGLFRERAYAYMLRRMSRAADSVAMANRIYRPALWKSLISPAALLLQNSRAGRESHPVDGAGKAGSAIRS